VKTNKPLGDTYVSDVMRQFWRVNRDNSIPRQFCGSSYWDNWHSMCLRIRREMLFEDRWGSHL
jgi:hypothetical protein